MNFSHRSRNCGARTRFVLRIPQANAQGTAAQDDPDAREWGEPGGTGVGGGGFGFDLRRPASLGGLKEWHCPFPSEATGIDHTWARITVFVEAMVALTTS
jgi:hypothetical protein